MKHLIHTVLILTFVFGACQDKPEDDPREGPLTPTGTLRLVVNPHWNGQPVADDNVYTDSRNLRYDINMLNMYLGDIQLGTSNGFVTASRIELFRLINDSREREFQLAPAVYNGAKFGIGVPADLNAANVNSYAPDSPLYSQNGTHWTMLNYRFVMLDAVADISATGSGLFDRLVSMHTGRDENYREVSSSEPVTIQKDSVTTLTVDVDVSKFFFSPSDTIDIRVENTLHGSDAQALLNERLSDHIQSAVTILE